MDVRSARDVPPVIEHAGTVPVWWLIQPGELKAATSGGFLELVSEWKLPRWTRRSSLTSHPRVLLHHFRTWHHEDCGRGTRGRTRGSDKDSAEYRPQYLAATEHSGLGVSPSPSALREPVRSTTRVESRVRPPDHAAARSGLERTYAAGQCSSGRGRNQGGRRWAILVAGSATLVGTLVAHRLVDELRLTAFPVLIGGGTALPDQREKVSLELIELGR